MAEPRAQHWYVECGPQQLLEALGGAFDLKAEPPEQQEFTLLDTFGWTIWHSGRVLRRQGDSSTYELIAANGSTMRWSADAKSPPPKFWWDFDEPGIRETLRRITGLWAITPVARLHRTRQSLALRDDQAKIVVRGALTDHHWDNRTQSYLTLEPMRGFSPEFARACDCIHALAEPAPDLSARSLLREQGTQPRDLRDKGGFGLAADMATEVAVRRMAEHMLQRARLFEAGVIDDTDTEFLHQFRVSLRKTRSLLNLMKRALPASDQRFLKRELSRIAGRTGDMRDLDVLLLSESLYRSMIPDRLQQGLDTLFALIAADRTETHQSVARFLGSTHYRNEIEAILANLRRRPMLGAPLAAKPILAVASHKIRRRYRTIAKMASHLAPDAPDHEIHAIRIECKKLRYLMEFFAELFRKKDTAPLIKTLKGLQDGLGDFNDYSVQQNFLLDLAARHPDDTALGAAVGALAVVLQDKHQSARLQVETDLAAFASADVAGRFEQVFAP